MLNKKLLTVMGVLLIGLVLMGAYNRPYRWWNALFSPLNIEDMNEQIILKPYHTDGMRAPADGSVAVDQWETYPDRVEVMSQQDKFMSFERPFPSSPEVVAKGEALYTIYCTPCHGPGMSANEEDWTPVKTGKYKGDTEPRFTGMAVADITRMSLYGYTGEKADLVEVHVVAALTNGAGIMKRMAYHLSPEERWQVAYYVRSLADEHQKNNQ